MNIAVIKFTGNKPDIDDDVMITPTVTVCKATGNDMSHVIGSRIYDNGSLATDEIMVGFYGGIDNH